MIVVQISGRTDRESPFFVLGEAPAKLSAPKLTSSLGSTSLASAVLEELAGLLLSSPADVSALCAMTIPSQTAFGPGFYRNVSCSVTRYEQETRKPTAVSSTALEAMKLGARAPSKETNSLTAPGSL